MRSILIEASKVHPSYEELSNEHVFISGHRLDSRGSVLEFREDQTKAVKQFILPTTRRSGVPDAGLHQALRSYLIRGALVERIILSIQQSRDLFYKLRMEVMVHMEAQEAAELLAATKVSKLDELKRSRPEMKRKLIRKDDDLKAVIEGSRQRVAHLAEAK